MKASAALEAQLVDDVLNVLAQNNNEIGIGFNRLRRLLFANVLHIFYKKAIADPSISDTFEDLVARVAYAERNNLEEMDDAIEKSALLEHLEWGLALLDPHPPSSDVAWQAYRLLARHKLHVRDMVDHAFGCLVPATLSAFDEVAYLRENPDVADAISRGDVVSGQKHFEVHGHHEGRQMRVIPPPPPPFVA